MAIEVLVGDVGEDAGKAPGHLAFFLDVGGAGQDVSDLRATDFGHFLGADDQHDSPLVRSDAVDPLVQRGGPRGTGVFDPGRRGEAHGLGHLQRQRRQEALAHEALSEMAEVDLVDVAWRDAGVGDRFTRDAGDQRLDIFALEFAKGCVGPADDASTHEILLGEVMGGGLRPPCRSCRRPRAAAHR